MSRREKGTGSWDTVTKKGITYYRFRKKYNGKIKEFTGRTKTAVRKKIDEFEHQSVKITQSEYEKMTLSDCIDQILSLLQPTLKPTNYATLRSTFRCYIETNNIKDIQMKNINRLTIQNYYNMLSTKYSESTVKKTRTLFNTIFNYLVDIKILTDNPASNIKMPHKSNYAVKPKEYTFLSYDESEIFFQTALSKANKTTPGVRTGDYIYGRNALFCIIILYTGMRIGEAYGLQWNDVNFDKGTIFISHSKGRIKNENTNQYEWIYDTVKKPSSKRIIPMTNRTKSSLLMLKNMVPGNTAHKDDFIFVTANNIPPSQSSLTRTLHSILERCDFNSKGFGLHDLRHSFGSILLEKGWRDGKPVDIKVISELLGHKDVSTTYNIYMHILQSHKAEAISLLD